MRKPYKGIYKFLKDWEVKSNIAMNTINHSGSALTKPLTICHIASGDLWAGAEVQVYNILRGLRNLEEFRIVAIIMNRGKLFKELSQHGIKTYLIDERKNSLFKQFQMIREIIKQNRIDVLHTHRYKENIFGALLRLSITGKYKLIKTQHGFFNIRPALKMRIYRKIDMIFSKYLFSQVVGVSEDVSLQIKAFGIKNKISTINNSICFEKYEVAAKNGFNSKRRKLKIGLVARLVKIKNIEEFIKITSDLLIRGIEIDAIVAGDGPEKDSLEKLSKQYGIDKNIAFLGNVNDISSVYNALDVLFITSHHEGLPTVLLESMYFKTIVIAKNIGGIPEVIDHEKNGFLYEQPEEAIGRIIDLTKNYTAYKPLQENARKDVEAKFGYMSQACKYASLYRFLVWRKKI